MEIVIQIAEKILRAFAPVGQWLCYSFHYNSNLENLKNQEEPFRNAKNRVQHSVDDALRNGKEIEDDVKTWLEKVDQATRKLKEIEAKAGNRSSNAACLNLKHRHQLSREAKKMMENIDQLLDEYHKNGNFEQVSYRPPPEGMETTRTMDYMAMESRITAVKEIMGALGNADIDKIGVWGMPGVGKSTLMKEIARQAREEKLFNEVVMAVVTDSPAVRRIQGEIAYTLGLNFDQETEKGRASQLKQRLSKDKKILVILDDIWKELDLQEIGIPSEGCKVLMTSRDRNVLVSKMDAQKDIELKILQEAEAFNLIEKIAGDSFKDQPEVRVIATKIAKKCAGLPIALVTVSKALKNKSLGEWKDTLRRLKRPAPEHITGMLKEIYYPIEVSYNNLESQELKSLFLLCAQLPYFLSYHALLIYSYGCDLFHDINTLEDSRDTLDTLLRKLKDSCLLSENSYGFFILHDLVRDVATIIASKDRNMFVMRYDDGRKEWPDVDALKRCQAFSISYGYFDEMKLQILNTLFQGMEKLKVLDLKNMRLPSLPSSLLGLRNLQTLCLDYCELEDISGIGELKNLVVLRLLHSKISTLPREIGSLVRLQMLDLSNCSKLEMIPPNIISCWGKLEELYMGNSIVQWEVEGLNEERKNASLAELKHLSNLNTLEIQIPDVSKLPKDLNFEKLERYKICIGDVWHWSDSVQSSRTLKLKLNSSIQSEFWNKMPLKRMEILHLNGVMSVNLSTLVIVFPTLETFILSNMIKLEEICQGELPSTSFKKLRVLELENCEKLRFVFSSSIARGLSLLEKLEIKRCNNMGAIVVKEEKDGIEDGDVILFPRLQTLVLVDLPELASFLSTRSSFTTDGRQIIAEGNRDLHMPLLHHQGEPHSTSFQKLRVLELENCEKLRFVFSSSIAKGLSLLEKLEIKRCNNMGAIVVKEEKDGIEDGDVILFPRLQTLVLVDLPELASFLSTRSSFTTDGRQIIAEGNRDLHMPLLHHQVSFPSLQKLCMWGLPKIKYVWSCGQEPKTVCRCIEQLKILEIMDCGVEEIVAGRGGGGGGEPVTRTILEFPRVTDLRLMNLKRLKWFYKGVHVTKWPMLERLQIQVCDKVEIFASGVVNFEETVEERQSEMSIKQPLFLVDEGELHSTSFQKLRVLELENCEKFRFVFSSSIARGLSLLEKLEIKRCKNMGAIVVKEEKDGIEDGDVILFPRLQTLVLEDLPELASFLSTRSSFTTDGRQIIAEGNRDLHMPLLHHQVSFPSLQTLRMWGLPKIKYIWSCGQEPKTVCRCLEQLKILEIMNCGVEEIVAGGGGGGGEPVTRTILEFPRVTDLRLVNLKRLQWFYKGVHVTKWPMLEKISISGCEKVEIFASGVVSFEETVEERQSEMSIKQPLFLVDEGKPHSTSFQKLRVLQLENCEKFRFVFSSSIAKGFSLLEILEIKRCNNMGAIVVKEEKDGIEDGDVILFQQLQTLVLERLPELVSFLSTRSSFMTDCGQIIVEGNRDLHMPLLHHQVSFPSLQTLRMWGLPKIKYVWSCGQEPKTVCRCLEQLKILEIMDCGVEEIVAGGGGGGGEPVTRTILEFPRVTDLRLKNLKRLKWFYKGVHVSKWPMLGMISISGCEKVEIFASGVVSFEETVKERSSEMSIKQPLFLVDELSFSSLKMLVIWNMDKLEIICQDQVVASSFFKNIQDMLIRGCEKLLHVFQSNFRTTTILTQHLTRLSIQDCSSLETIFRNMEGHNGKAPQVLIAPSSGTEESVAREDGTARHIEFPILIKMRLVRLPKLKWILEGVHTNLECPSLESLELFKCDQVLWASKFASNSSSQETSQQNQLQTCIQLPLPNLLELQVWYSGREEIFPYELVDPVPRLRRLDLDSLPMLTHLWKEDSTQPCPLFHSLEFLRLSECGKLKNIVPSSVFLQNLTELQISYCDGLINLLTSSTAETLVQLQKMTD